MLLVKMQLQYIDCVSFMKKKKAQWKKLFGA